MRQGCGLLIVHRPIWVGKVNALTLEVAHRLLGEALPKKQARQHIAGETAPRRNTREIRHTCKGDLICSIHAERELKECRVGGMLKGGAKERNKTCA